MARMHPSSEVAWTSPTRQSFVRRFALVYSLVTLAFSAYFTPQEFNAPIAIAVNLLLAGIGAPFWLRNSRIPSYWLNLISQLSNVGASVWICSFLGPTSHINLVAIPQFILALMMFGRIHPRTTFFVSIVCLGELSLPLFPFVDAWYLDKRMPEGELVVLRMLLDLTVFGLSAYQARILAQAWVEGVRRAEIERNSALKQNELRRKLLRVLGHDIKEPVVHSLLAVRSLRRRLAGEHAALVNQIESAQLSIREMISNIEISNRLADSDRADPTTLSREEHSVEGVMSKLGPWFGSRLQEKEITLNLEKASDGHRLLATTDSFTYQVVMNLLSNAVKFTPAGGTIRIETRAESDGGVVWCIQDTGEGIQDDAFAPEPISRSGTLGESGSGLGLKIARVFAEDDGIELRWLSPHRSERHPGFDVPEAGTVVLLIQRNPPVAGHAAGRP